MNLERLFRKVTGNDDINKISSLEIVYMVLIVCIVIFVILIS